MVQAQGLTQPAVIHTLLLMTSEEDARENMRQAEEYLRRLTDPASIEEVKQRARKASLDQFDSVRGVPPGTTWAEHLAENNGVQISSTEPVKPKRWWRK